MPFMTSYKQIFSSFEASLVRKQLGTVTTADVDAVRALFRRILELA